MDFKSILTAGKKLAGNKKLDKEITDNLIMSPESQAIYKNALDQEAASGLVHNADDFIADQSAIAQKNLDFLENGPAKAISDVPAALPAKEMPFSEARMVPAEKQKMSMLQKIILGGGATAAGGAGLYGMSSPSDQVPAPPANAPKDPMARENYYPDVPKRMPDRPTPTDNAAVATSQLSREISRNNPGLNPSAAAALGVPPSLEDSGFTENTVENLRAAQDQARGAKLVNDIGRAGAFLNAGIGGTDVNKEALNVFTQQSKDSGQVVEDFEKRAEKEKDDPKSAISKQFRDYMKTLDINVPANMSANAASKVMPYAYQKFAAKEAQIARSEENKLSRQAQREMKDATLEAARIAAGNKKDAKLTEQQASYGERIGKAVQNKEYEKFSKMNNVISRAEMALSEPSAQKDLALVYDFVKALDPDSAVREGEISFVGGAASVPQRVRKAMIKTTTGEQLLPEQRAEIIDIIRKSHGDQKKVWEASAAPALRRADKLGIARDLVMPDDFIDETAPVAAAPAASSTNDIKIDSFMKKNGITDRAEAISILKANGKI